MERIDVGVRIGKSVKLWPISSPNEPEKPLFGGAPSGISIVPDSVPDLPLRIILGNPHATRRGDHGFIRRRHVLNLRIAVVAPLFTSFRLTPLLMLVAVMLLAASPRMAQAEALLLIEADTGKVLQAENATYPWYPAWYSRS